MALWDKLSSRGHVEDRRSFGPVAAGGLSITGLAVLFLFNVLSGGDVSDMLSYIQPEQFIAPEDTGKFAGADDYEVFASTVLGSNNDLWYEIFNQNNLTYIPPTLVLFRTATTSSCGTATSQVGPHYCPLDQTIYLDETFFDELQNRFGAQGGDVAEAYVISHEVGHHAQNLLGTLNEANSTNTNENSIRIELQADCFAGLWAHSIRDQEVFLPGEIQEAMDAAAAVGDDRIQEKVTGYINPETWTHGSSEERVSWFNRGFETGEFSACNTTQ